MIETILVLILCILSVSLGYKLGKDNKSPEVEVSEEPKKKVKKHRPGSYNPNDLLNPITPLEQRMEASTVNEVQRGDDDE